jgi:hypothetical protein
LDEKSLRSEQLFVKEAGNDHESEERDEPAGHNSEQTKRLRAPQYRSRPPVWRRSAAFYCRDLICSSRRRAK